MLTRKSVNFYTGKRVFTKIEAGFKKLSHNESRESSKRDRQISTMHQEQHHSKRLDERNNFCAGTNSRKWSLGVVPRSLSARHWRTKSGRSLEERVRRTRHRRARKSARNYLWTSFSWICSFTKVVQLVKTLRMMCCSWCIVKFCLSHFAVSPLSLCDNFFTPPLIFLETRLSSAEFHALSREHNDFMHFIWNIFRTSIFRKRLVATSPTLKISIPDLKKSYRACREDSNGM